MYYEIRDRIVNQLIRFLLHHCCLDYGTIRAFVAKTYPTDLDMLNKERINKNA
jgi:hypothetical protein